MENERMALKKQNKTEMLVKENWNWQYLFELSE